MDLPAEAVEQVEPTEENKDAIEVEDVEHTEEAKEEIKADVSVKDVEIQEDMKEDKRVRHVAVQIGHDSMYVDVGIQTEEFPMKSEVAEKEIYPIKMDASDVIDLDHDHGSIINLDPDSNISIPRSEDHMLLQPPSRRVLKKAKTGGKTSAKKRDLKKKFL